MYLLAFELLLVLLDVTVNYHAWIQYGSVRRFFNLAREDGFGTWFSSMQWMATALICVYISLQATQTGAASGRKWRLVAAFFAYLSADEGAKIHERIGTVMARMASDSDSFFARAIADFPTYTWHFVFGPLLACAAVLLLVFLWQQIQDKSSRTIFITALGILGIAVGFDFVEGWGEGFAVLAIPPWLSVKDILHYSKVAEEFLEMAGASLFVCSLLSYAVHLHPKPLIEFR